MSVKLEELHSVNTVGGLGCVQVDFSSLKPSIHNFFYFSFPTSSTISCSHYGWTGVVAEVGGGPRVGAGCRGTHICLLCNRTTSPLLHIF